MFKLDIFTKDLQNCKNVGRHNRRTTMLLLNRSEIKAIAAGDIDCEVLGCTWKELDGLLANF